MWWLVERVEEYREYGATDNDIRYILRRNFNKTEDEIEDALLVADAHDMRVLED